MKNTVLATLFFACTAAALPAQSPAFCAEMLQKAQAELAKKQYSKSRDYCEAALPLCPEYADKLEAVMTDVRKAIEAETKKAIDAAAAAKRAQAAAEAAQKEALAQANTARQALQKKQAALADVVRLTLRDASDRIYHLDYEAGLEKIQSAAALGVLPAQVSDSLLEIAYFFAETRRFERAQALLDTAARLAGRDLRDLTTFQKMTNLPQTPPSGGRGGSWRDTLFHFRAALKTLNPARLDSLDARYFPTMMPIPGGVDTLNSDKIYGGPYAVKISTFYIARTEITWWQYNLFCAATGHKKPEKPAGWGGEGDNPVVNVRWYDAVEYANWLSERVGKKPAYLIDKTQRDSLNTHELDDLKWLVRPQPGADGYRLPTEAEWEYAARGGEEHEYAGSNHLDSVAWFDENSGSRTRPVGRKKANAFGLFDMSGNVLEWCWDWYYSRYAYRLRNDPMGHFRGATRVIRGGSWDVRPSFCRVDLRQYRRPDDRDFDLGFRLAFRPAVQ